MTSDPSRHLPLKPVDFHILLVLADRELHGYGMVKEIERRTDGAVRLEPGNLYRYVRRLESAGMVEPVGHRPGREDPSERRRYYGVTAFGRSVLAAEAYRMRTLAAVAEEKLALHGDDS